MTGTTRLGPRYGGATVLTRASVPWWTLVPLAVLLAFADAFWMVSIRGAVGAVERTDEPFEAWLRESTLSLPLFVLAVLAALTLAHRRRGEGLRPTGFVVTALLVVAAATLVGTAELVASAAYDYRLQMATLHHMDAMRSACGDGHCLHHEQQATLLLHVKAVAYGAGILLVTNVVAVLWAAGMRGGRLDVAAERRQRPGRVSGRRLARGSRADDLRLVAVAALVGAAVVHAVVAPEHLDHWPAAGGFFWLLAAAELGAAGLLLVGRAGPALVAAAVVSVGPLVLWAWSRTMGLPLGPEPGVREPVGMADIAAVVLELLTLLAVTVLWRRSPRACGRPPVSSHVAWLGALALVAVTAAGLGGSGLDWLDVTAGSGHEETAAG